MKEIVIAGARTHNLKNVHCAIPRDALTVISGVSGSGKSSLAFDTLYAEGQRRYVECMSTYARQFLERMHRPDVDSMTGIPPAIAIEQRNGVRNARSTVGSVTEIADFLRLLFARVGEVHCPKCDSLVARDTAQLAADVVLRECSGERVHLIAPTPVGKGDVAVRLSELVKQGYRRLFIDGKMVDRDALDLDTVRGFRELPLVVDRLAVKAEERARLTDSLYNAFALSGGHAEVARENGAPIIFNEGFACSRCGESLRAPEPALFSHSSPLGACEACQGFGRTVGVDWDKVIPDARKTLAEGAIAIFQTPSNRECQDDLERLAKKHKKTRLDVAWCNLRATEKKWILDGDPDYKKGGWKRGQWYGIRGFFRYLESKKYKMHVRVLLSRYRGYDTCEACQGTRLRPEARAVHVGGKSIAELEAMPVTELAMFLSVAGRALRGQARDTAQPVLSELSSRLEFLDEVGLGYLSLIRQARTLSGGEAQRIALASALGAQLTGTLYVLDEPSVGLHPRDSNRLLGVLRKLTARGNTVVVVEHEPEIIRAADHVIDLGPAAGTRGGQLVFEGSFAEMMRAPASPTGRFFRKREKATTRKVREARSEIAIRGANANNLKDVDVTIPVGKMICLTGVSGAGKSTLLVDVLHAQALRKKGKPVDVVGACDAVEGLEVFEEVVLVDQSPLSRSSRSNPATYLKAMDELRKRFAQTEAAQHLGLTAGAFSFNVSTEKGGGRCEGCQGQGVVTLEMHFLADITVVCDQCDGKRFREKILGVRVHGLSIIDCLNLTVDEALRVFCDEQKLCDRLRPFAEVGLGYLTLGQSTATLSGGESQRLKLAAHLEAKAGPTLFLLDEPTTGLHGSDVEVLVAALDRLLDRGHTIVTIEHNLDFIRRADHLIDLGPEAGAGGGFVVATGTPDEVAKVRSSHTGRFLAALKKAERDALSVPAVSVDLRTRRARPESQA